MRENLAQSIKKKHITFIVVALWAIFINFPSHSNYSLAPQQVHKVLIRDIFLDQLTWQTLPNSQQTQRQIKNKATEVEWYLFHGQINIEKRVSH